MAHDSSIFPISLVVLFLCVASSSAETVDTITVDQICQKHPNPTFCNGLLKSKDGMHDFVIGHYVISRGMVNATAGKILLDQLITDNIQNAALKQHYQMCLVSYDDAYKNFLDALKCLDERDYKGMYDTASAVKDNIQECDKSAPAPSQSVMMKSNEDMTNIGETVVILANSLIGSPKDKSGRRDEILNKSNKN